MGDRFEEVTIDNQNKSPFRHHKGGSYTPGKAWEKKEKQMHEGWAKLNFSSK
jgi:hypothetical protein